MSYKVKEDFLWFHKGDIIDKIEPNWKPYVEKTGKSKPNLDLNGDGVVDKKDASIAGKVLKKTSKFGKKSK